MNRRQRRTWAIFAGCVLTSVLGAAWLTRELLSYEQREHAMRAADNQRAQIEAALWRMDSWLTPYLVQESGRPASDYTTYSPIAQAVTNDSNVVLRPNSVLAPSPLLNFSSELFVLHFEVDAAGTTSSPQIPPARQVELAKAVAPDLQIAKRKTLLSKIAKQVNPKQLLQMCSVAESQKPLKLGTDPAAPTQQEDVGFRGQTMQRGIQPFNGYQNRASMSSMARNNPNVQWVSNLGNSPAQVVRVGALVPVWLDKPDGTHDLAFVRQVRDPAAATKKTSSLRYQGVLADWPALQGRLLAQFADLPIREGAQLRPLLEQAPEDGFGILTTVPARLVTASTLPIEPLQWTATRLGLLAAWALLLIALGGVGWTLRSTLAFGEKRARFASAVTHELRTPLTTFRMYSEMLAQGMVRDPDQANRYHHTLLSESDRLSRLVENVLGYAQIEENRFTAKREAMSLHELVERIRPALEQRAAAADLALEVAIADRDAEITIDADAVLQIVFNLVDNACKYACSGDPARVELQVQRCHETNRPGMAREGVVELRVRDYGPGIPEALQQRIFAAFDRGDLRAGDNDLPGIGLGLSLSRRLARKLDGELVIEPASPGALFVLRLPATRGIA